MSILIPVILIALILIPTLALTSNFERKRFHAIAAALQLLNENLHLSLKKPEIKFLPTEFPRLNGVFREKELNIYIETTHKNKCLVIEIILNDSENLSFTLREQTSLDNIGILAGEKDIETKDKIFDRKFFVSSNVPDKMIQFLNDQIRLFALKNFAIFEKGIITLEKGKLQYRHYSPLFVLKNKEKTLKIVEFLEILGNEVNKPN